MAKYFITLVLLMCLALENRNVYNRLHARSLPSSRGDILRPNPKHQSHPHVQHTSQQLQQEHHIRQQRSRQLKHLEPDPSEEDDAPITKQEYYARLRRHVLKKTQDLIQQELSYNHPAGEQFKVPRLWQHLMEQEEKSHRHEIATEEEVEEFPVMFADAPDESSFFAEELSPLDFVRNELMAGEEQQEQQEKDVEPQVPIVESETQDLGERNITISVKSRSGGCPKCESNRQVEHITEEQLTQLRIEFVKQQILEKLRLKESPKVSAVELPKPIFDGMTLSHPDDSTKNKELDDYYARTSKKFILLNREEVECNRLGGGKSNPSMCFSFKIDDADAEGFDVSTAVLWLFKNKQNRTDEGSDSESGSLNSTSSQQTIVVSEVEVNPQQDSKYLTATKTIAIQSVNVQDEWMKIDIEWPIKHWISGHELSHLIQISCGGCEVSDMEEIISVDKDYRPFIMIDMQNRRRKSRQKRSINCSSGMTECCREHLYISFRDIGWSNWILKPEGYNAYFCRGSCSSVASVTQAASHHSSIMKILSTSGANKSLELVPCCTAKQYSSLQLVVMDSSNTATVKTLPNMVVESCGCR
ncbi:growth/differentiation factor 8 [Drosophila gunungcola]|uniref:growth/differentiation factor 8 n=1 Tax=Drosophila gunungcola TaxID=103775 RepID=UPI0022E95278|nr:growth/differentiation factor 8 [Drosophila gunungcola]XP_052853073.1 growth/differentiation factor 8 [Drosophila gunungcola]